MSARRSRRHWWLAGLLLALLSVSESDFTTVQAATGDHVGSVNFSVPCDSTIGVGIAFDGINLWYSCYASPTDLYRANPLTGLVTASYSIDKGLGALAYDASRNALWAGWGGGATAGFPVWLIALDPAKNVVTWNQAGDPSVTEPGIIVCSLDDGLAYDGADDTLYFSDDCSTEIHHYGINRAADPLHTTLDTVGTEIRHFAWAGTGCYNSGLALGGNLLYEGSDGCSHVWVVDKATPSSLSFDFSTVVVGDPNFRDEDLECDNLTFAVLGKEVMWSVEAFEPRRAHAFEVPAGSCVFGGGGEPPPSIKGRMTGGGSVIDAAVGRVTHGFELHCDFTKLPNNLQVNWGKGNHFRLDALTMAMCTDDPAITPNPPSAGFDTYEGEGTGRCNGQPGATAKWKFTDAGEPGKNDTAEITTIGCPGGDISISGKLNRGNHQAHNP